MSSFGFILGNSQPLGSYFLYRVTVKPDLLNFFFFSFFLCLPYKLSQIDFVSNFFGHKYLHTCPKSFVSPYYCEGPQSSSPSGNGGDPTPLPHLPRVVLDVGPSFPTTRPRYRYLLVSETIWVLLRSSLTPFNRKGRGRNQRTVRGVNRFWLTFGLSLPGRIPCLIPSVSSPP